MSFADEHVHKHRREHVFADGVMLGNVLDAIAVAGAAENYTLAEQLSVQYALNVCCRCARHCAVKDRVPLLNYRINSWGSICAVCSLEFQAAGRRPHGEL